MYPGGAPPTLPDTIPQALKSSPNTCFALTESLDISYCNPAWDHFARENGGGPEVMAARVLHRPLLEFVPAELQARIIGLFAKARAEALMQSHDYDCSSPQLFRLFRMQVYPLRPGSGFVVINSLRVERPHRRQAYGPDDARYRRKNGIIQMCANCRRTCRVSEPNMWDWVPDYVQASRRDVSHGLCPFCREYYYGSQ